MYAASARALASKLLRWGVIAEAELDEKIYGLKNGIALIICSFTILVIGFLMGMPLEGAVFLAMFATLRSYTGGFHCGGDLSCYLSSCATTVLFLAACRYMLGTAEAYPAFAAGGAGVLLIVSLAPVEAPKKPIDDLERYVFRGRALRRMSAQLLAAILLHIFGLRSLSVVLLMTLALVGVTVLLGAAANNHAACRKPPYVATP